MSQTLSRVLGQELSNSTVPQKKSQFLPLFFLEAAALTQADQSFIPSSPQLGYVHTHSAA